MPQNSLYTGLLENHADRRKAVDQIVSGTPLVMQLGGVYGLFVNAENQNSVKSIFDIKGESKRSLTLVKRTDDIISWADKQAIHKDILEHLHDVGRNIGLVAHLRFPIDSSFVGKLPEHAYGIYNDPATGNPYPVVQYLDPSGHVYMSDFISELKRNGVEHVAVTSFNDHSISEPEITDPDRARELASEKGLPMILEDPLHARKDIKGSYAIILCFQNELKLLRKGAVDDKIINAIIENKLKMDELTKQTKIKNSHDFAEFISLLDEYHLTGERAKNAFVLYMMGKNPRDILKKLH